MKVEGANEQIQVLKLEVSVLNELSKRGNRHFCKIEDKGRFGNFNYVVMTLVGKSLQDLNKAGPGGHMTIGCSIGIGIQALEALEDLHNIGYLHRDVKPGNYTIGRPELNEIRKVYILDFGMCRKFTGNDVSAAVALRFQILILILIPGNHPQAAPSRWIPWNRPLRPDQLPFAA